MGRPSLAERLGWMSAAVYCLAGLGWLAERRSVLAQRRTLHATCLEAYGAELRNARS